MQIKAQLAEQIYRAFNNGVKQPRESERSGEFEKKNDDEIHLCKLVQLKKSIQCDCSKETKCVKLFLKSSQSNKSFYINSKSIFLIARIPPNKIS